MKNKKQNSFQYIFSRPIKAIVGLIRYKHAVEALPLWTYKAFRHGAVPMGWSALQMAKKEGLNDLHWKVLGDGLVRFLSESGPALTKFGQILSTRNDILPDKICHRLQALYTDQPPISESEIKSILKKAYGRSLPFEEFDYSPIAVGSIGAVHRAKIKGKQRVVVKLLRPGVKKLIRRDMDAIRLYMQALQKLSGTHSAVFHVLDRMLQDLASGFEQETDLKREANAFKDFRKLVRRNHKVYVPRLYEKFCKDYVIVMEELEGTPLAEYREQAKSDPQKAKQLADLALKEILRQIFDEGKFHGDPHAGNFIVLPDGRLGIVDLGLTGEFGPTDRKKLVEAIKAFVARDADKVIKSLLKFGDLPSEFDHVAFKKDIVDVVKRHKQNVVTQAKGESADEANNITDFVNELFSVAYRYRIHVPASTTVFIKTLVTIEGVARTLDPELNLFTVALPVVLRSTIPKWLRWK